MQPRLHDFAATGIPCGDGCLLLADEARLRRRAVQYRIDVADLQRLIQRTEGWCMVCRHCHASIIEHCHATNRVRGIVCRWCNTRITSLEGGTTNRHVVYRRGFSCSCVSVLDGEAREAGTAALELATYRFIDHAMDLAAPDARRAFAILVSDPYPS